MPVVDSCATEQPLTQSERGRTLHSAFVEC